MNICYIATTVHVSKDLKECLGSTTQTYALSKEFTKQGHSVHLITKKLKDDKEFEILDGINVHRLYRGVISSGEVIRKKRKTFISPILRGISNIFLGIKASKIVRQNNCDVIFERAHSMQVGTIASIISKKPLFLQVIDNFFSPIATNHAKKIIANTDVFFNKKALSKLVLVEMGIDHETFKPVKVKQIYDLCYVGGFKPWDGVEDLVLAVKHLKKNKSFNDLSVLLLGDGPRVEVIKKMVKENNLDKNFLFGGKVSLQEVANHICASKICVAPFNVKYSKTGEFEKYGFYFPPLKVIEYMACSKPVIATNYEFNAKLIPKNTRFLFQEGNVKDLSEIIKDLLTNRDLKKIGEENFIASKNFTSVKTSKRIINEFKDIALS